MGRAEGKIKADGTTLGHRAQISWSAHWLGEGARHRRKAAQCRALAKRQHLWDFWRHHGWFYCVFALIGWSSADEPG